MKKLIFWLFVLMVVFLLIAVLKQNPNSIAGATVSTLAPTKSEGEKDFRMNFEIDKTTMNKIIEQQELNVQYDEFQDVVFVQYDNNLGMNFVSMYLASKNTSADRGVNDLRMVINYFGDDWVFWDEVTFLVDGKRFEFDYSMLETHRDANGGTVSEYYDVLIQDEKNFLEGIERCVSIKYRLSGSKWYERELTRKEIDDLKDMIKLYKLVESNQFFIGSLDD
jgi:hypothetical protein